MATKVCARCNTVNPESNSFCQACGAPLMAPVIPQQPVKAVRPAAPVPPTGAYPPPPPPGAYPASGAAYPPPPPGGGYGYPPVAVIPHYPHLDSMGARVDSYSEVITGEGARAEKVEAAFVDLVKKSEIPSAVLAKKEFISGDHRAPRGYQVLTLPGGASIAATFQPVGKDLFIGWDMYVKQGINWLTFGITVGAAFLLALLAAFVSIPGGGWFNISTFFMVFVQLLVGAGLIEMWFGKVLKGDLWYLFVNQMNFEDALSLDGAEMIVDEALSDALDVLEEPVAPEPKKKK